MSFPSETGRLPTLEALERELVARAGTRIPPRNPRATLVAAVIAFIVALTALTPFGRAVAEQIADWIGIGDPPTREQQNPIGEPAVVIGYGTVEGVRYEIVASTRPPQSIGAGPFGCISIDFPGRGGMAMGSCLTEEARASLQRTGISAYGTIHPGAPEGLPLMITGVAPPETTRVVIASDSSSTEAGVSHLTPELAEEIGFEGEFSYFVAFLPADTPEPLTAEGLSGKGESVGSGLVDVRSLPPAARR
jgi:hypothetical protein